MPIGRHFHPPMLPKIEPDRPGDQRRGGEPVEVDVIDGLRRGEEGAAEPDGEIEADLVGVGRRADDGEGERDEAGERSHTPCVHEFAFWRAIATGWPDSRGVALRAGVSDSAMLRPRCANGMGAIIVPDPRGVNRRAQCRANGHR